jgi:uncharacterized protein with GYD domain
MALYMLHGSYSAEGTRGLLKDGGSKRKAVVEGMLNKVGGKVHGLWFALGEDDVYVVAEIPDQTTALAMSVVVNATGAIRLKTTALITAEQMDAATKKSIEYRAPGA